MFLEKFHFHIHSFHLLTAYYSCYVQYHCSLTTTKNIGLLNSLLSPFDLLFIVLDQMEPGIDRHISEHVLRMHSFCSTMDRDKRIVAPLLKYS